MITTTSRTTRISILCASLLAPFQIVGAEPQLVSCPSQRFEPYLEAFTNSLSVQHAYTKVPLKASALVDAEPEPRPQLQLLDRAHIKFPVIPSLEQQQKLHLIKRIDNPLPNQRRVTLAGSDTDFLVTYQFVRYADCWWLVRMDDQSL